MYVNRDRIEMIGGWTWAALHVELLRRLAEREADRRRARQVKRGVL